jgi:hypothetical protein
MTNFNVVKVVAPIVIGAAAASAAAAVVPPFLESKSARVRAEGMAIVGGAGGLVAGGLVGAGIHGVRSIALLKNPASHVGVYKLLGEVGVGKGAALGALSGAAALGIYSAAHTWAERHAK